MRRILIGLLWVALGAQAPLRADTPPPPEYLIKAAFIYNFAMFVEWPADAFKRDDSPIVIGILGSDPFGTAIDQTVQDKRVKKRPIVIKRLQWGQDAGDCHILFVSSAEGSRVGELVPQLKSLPVLVVGESQGFARRGGIINFTIEDNRVRCEINVEAAKRSRLNISSKLLSLARIVQ